MVDCRSEEGITIGLIDTILTCSNILVKHNLKHQEIEEALLDLYYSIELKALLKYAADVSNRETRDIT